MIIANPMYDSVFKYLMEDLEIARELLSVLLREQIKSLTVKQQETSVELAAYSIAILRMDFKAVIVTAKGKTKKVAIELQKARHFLDIIRFRRYLAANYRETDTVKTKKGEEKQVPLELVAVYFLGFKLSSELPPVSRVFHQVENVVTGAVVDKVPKEPFIQLLNHESYLVQIPSLKNEQQTRIERVLSVFNQQPVSESDHQQLNYIGTEEDPLVARMVNRLNRAASDEDVRTKMDMEDEVERSFMAMVREKDGIIEAKEQVIADQAKVIADLLQKLNQQAT